MPFPKLSYVLAFLQYVSEGDLFLTFGALQDGKSYIHLFQDHWRCGT